MSEPSNPSRCSRAVWMIVSVGMAALVGCADESGGDPDRTGVLAGQVVVSGPLRHGRVSVDQLLLDDPNGAVREHVGDTMTDEDGRYSIETGLLNGVLLVRVQGGEFDDLATGTRIVLDAGDEIRTLHRLDVFEERSDALVSPIGHLIEAYARARLAAGRETNILDAFTASAAHLNAHFGNLDWSRLELADLSDAAASPTAPVRAALIHAAWSVLAQDVAGTASASPQEVNVHELMAGWGDDIGMPPFDGNDGNDRAYGSGLQLGVCPPLGACTVSDAACTIGECRTLCDLYSGTPRALLAGALTKVIRSSTMNQTGLQEADAIAIARAMTADVDADLFGPDACVEQLDRLPPTITWEEPAMDADPLVAGTLLVRVRAADDGEFAPRVWFDGLDDIDGDPDNDVAIASIDTATLADGPLEVTAVARDFAGLVMTVTRTFDVDNAAPTLTWPTPSGPSWYIESNPDVWWTSIATATLTGTVTDAHPVSVTVQVGTSSINATVSGSTWSAAVPIDASTTTVTVRATDSAGNTASIARTLRADTTAPFLTMTSQDVHVESMAEVSFDVIDGHAIHTHLATATPLGPAATCDVQDPNVGPHVYKFAYLLDEQAPSFSTENEKNPVEWSFSLSDDGIGVDLSSAEYQVRLGTMTLVPWTKAPEDPSTTGGFKIPLYRNVAQGSLAPAIPELGTTEDVFSIDFRGRDRFQRETVVTRCWSHHPLAAPLKIDDPTNASDATTQPADPLHQKWALSTLKLSQNDDAAIAAHILNEGSMGTGLIDFNMHNPTAEDVYVTLVLSDTPDVAKWTSSWQDTYSELSNTFQTECGANPAQFPAKCKAPVLASSIIQPAGTPAAATVDYSLRVWDTTSGYVELTPESVNGTAYRFKIAKRTSGVRHFVASVVIGTIDEVRPGGSPPYGAITLNAVSYTGKTSGDVQGCKSADLTSYVDPDTELTMYRCMKVRTYRRYRALGSAAVTFGSVDPAIAVNVKAAPTPELAPYDRKTELRSAPDWSTSETLPAPNP